MHNEAFLCLVRGYALAHLSPSLLTPSLFHRRSIIVLGIVPNSIRSVVFWRPDIKDCVRVVTFQGPFVQFRICTQDFVFGGINLAKF